MTIPGIIKKNNPTDIIKVINKFRARVLRNILNCENKSVNIAVSLSKVILIRKRHFPAVITPPRIRYKSEKEMERYPRLLSSSVLLEVSSPVKILATNMVQTANVHRLVNCLLAWLFKDCVSKIVTSYIILINNKIHYIAYFIIG